MILFVYTQTLVDETFNTVSYKEVKESKKEARQIGDSDRE
ncbi:MAG: hypothetical protein K0S93_910 [Nitrososphaeraceae archaeon]|jgi:hypothetical protein|nr:hypothetical protein [Nitrososphaeraceae archaeon]